MIARGCQRDVLSGLGPIFSPASNQQVPAPLGLGFKVWCLLVVRSVLPVMQLWITGAELVQHVEKIWWSVH